MVHAGNHDITLDADFYREHGARFHNQRPEDLAQCQSLLTSSRSITYLLNSSATIRLTRPDGPGTIFTVFGSPYSPEYGTWAFMYPQSAHEPSAPGSDSAAEVVPTAGDLWAAIPLSTDILVTHTPAYGHCDDSHGCYELRRALARVRPRLHVCGHVHQGRGAERVKWDTDSLRSGDGTIAVEASVEAWVDPSPDPASAKISLVDLTARRGNPPLDFDDPESVSSERECPGQGTTTGRVGRKETCIVNCAIVSTSWPHKGGKRFNKPIVVDLDLPVWR